jgi:hypothetical protein
MKRKINHVALLAALPFNAFQAKQITELGKEFGVPPGTLHYHLKALANEGRARQLPNLRWIAIKQPDSGITAFADEPVEEQIEVQVPIESHVEDEPVYEPINEIDYSNLNIPQLFAKLSEIHAHEAILFARLATLTFGEEESPVVTNDAGEQQCDYSDACDYSIDIKDESNIEDGAVIKGRATIYKGPFVYDPDDYSSYVGKFDNNHIFVKYIVLLYNTFAKKQFTKDKVEVLFLSECYKEINRIGDLKRRQKKIDKLPQTARNRTIRDLAFLREVGCLHKEDARGGKYKFIISPMYMLDIIMPDDNKNNDMDDFI